MGIVSGQQNFLADMYLGTFNRKLFETLLLPDQKNEQVSSIIDQYRSLIANYSPSELEKAGSVPDELLQGLRDIGIFGLNIPKSYGGQGLSLNDYLKVIEDIARTDMSLAIIPTAHLSIGVKGILLFGTEAQKGKYLSQAASGSMIFAYALTEPKTGSDAQHIETKAKLSTDGRYYILNGLKTYITNGGYADGIVTFAQMDPDKPGFMGAFIVESSWDGIKIGKPMKKMGLTISSTTSITLTNVKVPVENLIGKPGDGFKIAMSILNYGRLGLGAASVGVMRQSVEDMYLRASSRKQFGVPIKEFELIQEKIVRTRVYCSVSAALTRFTAKILEKNPNANVAIESSHTKLFSTTRAWKALYDALQVAGGAGYLSTLPYEKRMRDFRVTTIFEGTTEIHSIYPPLTILRSLNATMSAYAGKHPIKRIFFLVRKYFSNNRIAFDTSNAVEKKALRFINRNAVSIRRLIFFGFIRHGKKITKHEFFLRRITNLSLYLYGVLCMLADIHILKQEGEKVDSCMRELGYFLAEAEFDRKANYLFSRSRKEVLSNQIFNDLNQ